MYRGSRSASPGEAATNRPNDNGRRGMNRPKYIIHAHSITEASPTPSLTFSGASLRLFVCRVMRKTNGTVVRMHCETNYRVKFMDPPASACSAERGGSAQLLFTEERRGMERIPSFSSCTSISNREGIDFADMINNEEGSIIQLSINRRTEA